MFKKILLGLLFLVVGGAIIFYIVIQLSWNKTYDIAYPDLKVSTDPEVIARGEYLVKGPSHCVVCHVSNIEESIEAERTGNVALKGGRDFPMGPIATLHPANLTPDTETGIGRYEDGAIFRMMRHVVKADGTSSLAPLMPFYNMADDELVAIVSYLKSQEPVRNEVPPAKYSLLGKFIKMVSPVFQPILESKAPKLAPAMEATVERGEYLARFSANCFGCHTQFDMQTMEQVGEEFAGGNEFLEPALNKANGIDDNVMTRSPNLTSHPTGVLSKYSTVEEWIQKFRNGRAVANSPMPWGPFSRMTDEDLSALYLFLKSLDPVDNDTGPVVFTAEE